MTKRDLILETLKNKIAPLTVLQEVVTVSNWKNDAINIDELPLVNLKDKSSEIEKQNDYTNTNLLRLEVEIFTETQTVVRDLAQKVFSALIRIDNTEPYYEIELIKTELIVEANALFILTFNVFFISNKNEI